MHACTEDTSMKTFAGKCNTVFIFSHLCSLTLRDYRTPYPGGRVSFSGTGNAAWFCQRLNPFSPSQSTEQHLMKMSGDNHVGVITMLVLARCPPRECLSRMLLTLPAPAQNAPKAPQGTVDWPAHTPTEQLRLSIQKWSVLRLTSLLSYWGITQKGGRTARSSMKIPFFRRPHILNRK